MVDNKSKTPLIRHIQKNISLMKINNTRASHSYNIVIFTRDIFFSVYVIQKVFLLYIYREQVYALIYRAYSVQSLSENSPVPPDLQLKNVIGL